MATAMAADVIQCTSKSWYFQVHDQKAPRCLIGVYVWCMDTKYILCRIFQLSAPGIKGWYNYEAMNSMVILHHMYLQSETKTAFHLSVCPCDDHVTWLRHMYLQNVTKTAFHLSVCPCDDHVTWLHHKLFSQDKMKSC